MDGKARKDQLQFEPDNACTIHDIEAFCHDVGVVLAQLALDNQHGEAELSGAPKLVSSISWQGRILTGDALYCQVQLCEMVLGDGGDYLVVVRGNQPQLLVVRGNQPQLLEELDTLFQAPEMQNAQQAKEEEFDYRSATTVDKGHGRIEERVGIASTDLAGYSYSRWPGLSQVVQIKRKWEHKGVIKSGRDNGRRQELDPCGARRSGDVGATHYGGELVTQVSLLHRGGLHRIASALRANSQRPHQALMLMGLLNSSDA